MKRVLALVAFALIVHGSSTAAAQGPPKRFWLTDDGFGPTVRTLLLVQEDGVILASYPILNNGLGRGADSFGDRRSRRWHALGRQGSQSGASGALHARRSDRGDRPVRRRDLDHVEMLAGSIRLVGGLKPNRVLFNLVSTGESLFMAGGSRAAGTFLVPSRKAGLFLGSFIDGALIAGGPSAVLGRSGIGSR